MLPMSSSSHHANPVPSPKIFLSQGPPATPPVRYPACPRSPASVVSDGTTPRTRYGASPGRFGIALVSTERSLGIVAGAVARGTLAREERRMRGQRPRAGGERARVDRRLRGQRVQIRTGRARVPVASEMIGAGRVERDQQKVRTIDPTRAACGQRGGSRHRSQAQATRQHLAACEPPRHVSASTSAFLVGRGDRVVWPRRSRAGRSFCTACRDRIGHRTRVTSRSELANNPISMNGRRVGCGPSFVALFAGALTIAVFWPASRGGFVWDDANLITTRHDALDEWSDVPAAFGRAATGRRRRRVLPADHDRELRRRRQALRLRGAGVPSHQRPVARHERRARRARPRARTAVGSGRPPSRHSLFGLHPLQCQAVALILGRNDVQLVTTVALMLVADEVVRRRGRPYLADALVALGFALTLWTKETGIVAPIFLVLLDVLWRGKSWSELRARVPLAVALGVIVVLYFATRVAVIGAVLDTGHYGYVPLLDRPRARRGDLRVLRPSRLRALGSGARPIPSRSRRSVQARSLDRRRLRRRLRRRNHAGVAARSPCRRRPPDLRDRSASSAGPRRSDESTDPRPSHLSLVPRPRLQRRRLARPRRHRRGPLCGGGRTRDPSHC